MRIENDANNAITITEKIKEQHSSFLRILITLKLSKFYEVSRNTSQKKLSIALLLWTIDSTLTQAGGENQNLGKI